MQKYQNQLLQNWEGVYKKGQLTLWIMLALKSGPKSVEEIKEFIEQVTAGTIICEEQSLYRALRKFYDVELVDFQERQVSRGPKRKFYRLSKIGVDVLEHFIERNIRLFYQPDIKKLIRKDNN